MLITLPVNLVLPWFPHLSQNEKTYREIIAQVQKLDYKDCKRRDGCFIATYNKRFNNFNAQQFGGIEDSDKKLKYLACATEKVTRMARYNLGTSFSMADDKLERYGGGISLNNELYVACSAYPPEVDEAVSYLVAFYGLDHLSDDELTKLLIQTKNQFAIKIHRNILANHAKV